MRLRFGNCVFDSDVRELSRGGARVPLTPKAFALLEALIEKRPEPMSRESIVALLWPDTVVEPGNLHNLVSEIRSAIADEAHDVIRTVHRFGYSFDAAGAIEENTRFVAVMGGDDIPLRSGENLIGRDPSCTIVIESSGVSRRHARLLIEGGGATLEDLGSKNGTFIGTKRINGATELRSGDEIIIGTTSFAIRAVNALPSTKTIV